MWLLNHLYNHCLEKLLDSHQPIPTMGHNLTYVQENFGALARMPILMWGFSTPMLPATAPEVCLLHTRNMKMKRNEHMASVYLKWTWRFYPLILSTWYGKRSTNLLQALGWLAVSETWCTIQHPHGLVEMQVAFCHPQICSHVHPKEQILHAPCPRT